jgi:[acyl-carrier-protein] S-malonyltransferase
MALAFVFPGQGSQSIGMLSGLDAGGGTVREAFAAASEALGRDLWRLSQEGPEDELNRTEWTQPALLAAGLAAWRVWQVRGGPQPALMAGHSLGEYTALVAAGALDFADAVRLVHFRGQVMQEAVPQGEGAMAAVLGLDDAVVAAACREAAGDRVVEPVNFNAPGQVVIAGHRDAVERALAAAETAGAKRAIMLPVSVPSHCALMRPAAERMAERLQEVQLRAPAIPVLHNVSVAPESNPEKIRERLVAQLHSPVRWVETIKAFGAAGVDRLIEAGPGKVLAGLNRRIDRAMDTLPVFDDTSLEKALAAVS